jgi:hypothetical protein
MVWSSVMSSSSMCRRPAVSRITVSYSSVFASASALRAMSIGLRLSPISKNGTFTLFATMRSWSIAAGR